ncbi:MAG: efflux RND transporter periplasmic adaptor subunit [Gemmatimonadales bacterium]
MKRLIGAAALALGLVACTREEEPILFEKVAVARRDLVVSASASGAIEPVLTVDVKSKASGEITEMHVQTGDDVRQSQMLATIDPRVPRNSLAQAEANLVVAEAQLANAKSQMARADTLYKTQAITETEYETARLGYANANAAVIRAKTDLENARDRMTDTRIRAPMQGTIIAKNVELGTVISSPTQDVGGGTLLFKMANLDTVQVRTLVDETDIGKVQPGLSATITVDAYPNRPFEGSVLKIEPQATVQQNVTMFPVLVRIANPGHLLKPGMNTEVEIHIGRRDGVLAVPNAALRTQRDVASAAQVLGLDPEQVQQQLAQARPPASGTRDSASLGGTQARRDSALPSATSGGSVTITLPDGRTVPAPPGTTAAQARLAEASMQKRMRGETPTAEEQAAGRAVFAALRGASDGGGGGGAGGGGGRLRLGGQGRGGDQSGSYIVFALRDGKPAPVQIATGLTDLDYTEVRTGLTEQDTVLVLPSASLLNSQREMRERFQRMTGGGLPGVQQQPAGGQRPQTTTPPPRP